MKKIREIDCRRLLHVDVPDLLPGPEADSIGVASVIEQQELQLGAEPEDYRRRRLVAAARAREAIRQEEYQMTRKEHAFLHDVLLPSSRPAREKDYVRWLRGYVETYHKALGETNREWRIVADRWRVMTKDVVLQPLHGARACGIIVPKKIDVRFNPMTDLGHIQVYQSLGFLFYGIKQPVLFRGMKDVRPWWKRAMNVANDIMTLGLGGRLD